MKIRFKQPFLGYEKGDEDDFKFYIPHKDEQDEFGVNLEDIPTLIQAGILEEVKEDWSQEIKDKAQKLVDDYDAGVIIFGATAPSGTAQPVLMTKEYAQKIENLLHWFDVSTNNPKNL